MKKSLVLLMCAVSPLLAVKEATKTVPQAVESAVSGSDMKHMEEAATNFNLLKAEFEKWGVNAVWDQIKGINTNAAGGRDISTAYSLFADPKRPMFAVVDGKLISADPKKNGTPADDVCVKQIIEKFKDSKDGQVVVEYTRMEQNPADKDSKAVEVKYKAVAWNQHGFGLKDAPNFFVFEEMRAS